MTSIAMDTLKKVAKALDVDMNYFMEQPNGNAKATVHTYEREALWMEDKQIPLIFTKTRRLRYEEPYGVEHSKIFGS